MRRHKLLAAQPSNCRGDDSDNPYWCGVMGRATRRLFLNRRQAGVQSGSHASGQTAWRRWPATTSLRCVPPAPPRPAPPAAPRVHWQLPGLELHHVNVVEVTAPAFDMRFLDAKVRPLLEQTYSGAARGAAPAAAAAAAPAAALLA